jgi:hypothetical protein
MVVTKWAWVNEIFLGCLKFKDKILRIYCDSFLP